MTKRNVLCGGPYLVATFTHSARWPGQRARACSTAAMSQGAPIDLTTPPSSPPRAPEDDEVQEVGKADPPSSPPRAPEDDKVREVVKAEFSSAGNRGKRRKTEASPMQGPPPSQQDDLDDDCMEVDVNVTELAPTFRGLGANGNEQASDDEELIFVGRKGDNALADFPHAREYCVTFKFVLGKELSKCANCYCYCCDEPAAKCTEWAAHCKATNTSHWWRAQREARKDPAGAAVASSSSAAASSDPLYEPRWSCDQMLGEIQQVYPAVPEAVAGLHGVRRAELQQGRPRHGQRAASPRRLALRRGGHGQDGRRRGAHPRQPIDRQAHLGRGLGQGGQGGRAGAGRVQVHGGRRQQHAGAADRQHGQRAVSVVP